MSRSISIAATLLLALLWMSGAQAEPYFAVREGLKCASCHVNPSGGGLRNAFGIAWAQTALPAQTLKFPEGEAWTGSVNRYLAVGGNLRADYSYTDVPDEQAISEFELEEARAYLAASLVPDRVLLYVDQRLAPGSSATVEAYARYTSANQHWYVKAGRMVLPYGLRLEDDTAFIRQVTGIGFDTPDEGVELGWESDHVSAQLAVSNGTAGGPETDKGKQASLRGEYVSSIWRAGVSLNYNDADAGERRMQGLFAGVRTGPIAWLAEADYLVDDSFPDGRRNQWTGLVEANWNFRRGHNLKLTVEGFDPDDDVDEDEQARYSLVWEYMPVQLLQLRAGARAYDGIPQNALQNRRFYFLSMHAFF
jgi:hypothetical protein